MPRPGGNPDGHHPCPIAQATNTPMSMMVVAKWCGELDIPRMQAHLAGETQLEADSPEVVLDAKTGRLAA